MLDHYSACLPASDRAQRAAALQGFAALGFPGKSLESWHYTDFSHLSDQTFVPAQPAATAPAYPYDAARLLPMVEVGPAAYDHPGFALEGLSQALAVQGVVTVLSGECATPLLITQPDPGSGQMNHWRHDLSLQPEATATVLLWDAPGNEEQSASFATGALRLSLGEGSRLCLIRIQQAPALATRALHVAASVAQGANLQVITLDLSPSKSRFELHASLDGAGASAAVFGLSAVSGKAHADTQVQINHAAAHCTSKMEFRLLAAGRSKVVFNGKVRVDAGAIKTDSETRCHSLLLSGTAEIDAKPELEINADDVKCAHGATFGQLDDAAAFYLRSRGIGADEARSLLTRAFSQSVIERITQPLLRAYADAQVQALLEGAQA